MKLYLCIPHASPKSADGKADHRDLPTKFTLNWTDHHPSSESGRGVLLDGFKHVFDGQQYRKLHDKVGVWLEGSEAAMERAAKALAIPAADLARKR